jgi:hypothetical protein
VIDLCLPPRKAGALSAAAVRFCASIAVAQVLLGAQIKSCCFCTACPSLDVVAQLLQLLALDWHTEVRIALQPDASSYAIPKKLLMNTQSKPSWCAKRTQACIS